MKDVKSYIMNNKEIVSLIMGIASIVIPVIVVVTFIMSIFLLMFEWIIIILGIFGVIFGVRKLRRRRPLPQEVRDKKIPHKNFFSVIIIVISIIALLISLSMVIDFNFIIVWVFVGFIAGIVGLIFGIIEIWKINRLPLDEKSNHLNNKRFALNGIICSVIGILLQGIFVILSVLLIALYVDLFLDVMTRILSIFTPD